MYLFRPLVLDVPEKTILFLKCVILSLFLSVGLTFSAQAENPLVTYETELDFEDAKMDLENAIIGKGLKTVYTGHMATMLERTSKETGTPNPYKHAEYVLFCSAKLSSTSVNADNKNIGFCPYIIFLYETKAKPGWTTIGYRKPLGGQSEASKKALVAIDKLINSVAREAAGVEE